LVNTCGGTPTATAGSGSVSLAGGSLAANASCTVSLNVTGTTAGVKNNTTGAISATETGAGTASNTASVTVVAPPIIAKAFGAPNIALNGTTSLSFTISNSNTTTALTGVGFIDALPSGLSVASPNGLTGTCGGGTITATAGSDSVSLSGASLAASTPCTFSVNVKGTTSGLKTNTTGNVTSTEGGSGNMANASLTVDPALVRIAETLTSYATIQDAYLAATDGQTIQVQSGVFTESLVFSSPIAVKLRGGYDATFTNVTGTTQIAGSIVISDGSVDIDGIVIE
jgi:hypothetical protein